MFFVCLLPNIFLMLFYRRSSPYTSIHNCYNWAELREIPEMFEMLFVTGHYIFCWIIFTQLSLAQRNCYYPDGTLDAASTPCVSTTEYTACCAPAMPVSVMDIASRMQTPCWDLGVSHVPTSHGKVTRVPTTATMVCYKFKCTVRSFTLIDLVRPSAGISVLLVVDQSRGLYCCGSGYNGTSNTCAYPTHGSYTAFELPGGSIIFNRTSGSTDLPSAAIETLPVTVTATPTPTSTEKQVSAMAVGIPLGVLLGIAIVLLAATVTLWQRSRTARKSLHRQMKESRELAEKEKLMWKESKKHLTARHELNDHSLQEIGSSRTMGQVYEVGEERVHGGHS